MSVSKCIAAGQRRADWLRRQWKRKPRCHYCGRKTRLTEGRNGRVVDNEATCDHYMPLALGGADAAHNWRLACALCNCLKGDLPPARWWSELVSAGIRSRVPRHG